MFSVNVMYMKISSFFVIKHTNCQMCFQFKLYHSKMLFQCNIWASKYQELKRDHATAEISWLVNWTCVLLWGNCPCGVSRSTVGGRTPEHESKTPHYYLLNRCYSCQAQACLLSQPIRAVFNRPLLWRGSQAFGVDTRWSHPICADAGYEWIIKSALV